MKPDETSVQLELHITIEDDGQIEENTTRQTGSFYQLDNKHVLRFVERLDDGSSVNNLLTIQSDKVSMKRSGTVSMYQQFDENRITENVYQHPYGKLLMETKTESIDYTPPLEHSRGLLRLDYTVKLNGQEERQHTLTLSIKKEAS